MQRRCGVVAAWSGCHISWGRERKSDEKEVAPPSREHGVLRPIGGGRGGERRDAAKGPMKVRGCGTWVGRIKREMGKYREDS